MLVILVVGILVSSGFGAVALNSDREKFDTEIIGYNKSDFTHTVLGEFGTATTCVPCKYAHQALKEIYACEWYLFHYVTLVRDKNDHALKRTEELNQFAEPTVFFDGGYEKVEGAVDKEKYMLDAEGFAAQELRQNEVFKGISGIYKNNFLHMNGRKIPVYFKKKKMVPKNGSRIKIHYAHLGYYKKLQIVIYSQKDFEVY